MQEALYIHVKGVVQGVGFRPFVYRCAKHYLIHGWVLNAADGVFIHAEGESKLLDEFVIELSENPPAAATVSEIELKEVPLEGFDSFEIRFSDESVVDETTLVSPDIAMCDDCFNQLMDPSNRRYRYPFINCTNCGPRFTIIERLPYDRAHTSMKAFPQCSCCQGEYDDPLNRRFHAQPNACFDCGPKISWRSTPTGKALAERVAALQDCEEPLWGTTREQSDALFARAVDCLRAGGIVAVKGLGGFHLACDAENPAAIAELRRRKHREGKPFAVMVEHLEDVERLCFVNETEGLLLSGSQRPIVLLRKRPDANFAAGLADNLGELGVMLPYTPVQQLLLHDFGGMLVMTSGNLHDEPIVTDDEQASLALGGIADAILGNDRPIRTRYDDSVVRVLDFGAYGNTVQVVRRARGFSPVPLNMPSLEDAAGPSAPDAPDTPAPSVFAAGPEQKNTFCLTRGTQAFVSQHIGDMENAETFDAWLEAKVVYERLFDMHPELCACDAHPEYLTSKWAHEQAERGARSNASCVAADATSAAREPESAGVAEAIGAASEAANTSSAETIDTPSAEASSKTATPSLPVVEVQHHHAHIVSAMAENGLEGPVLGLAFDGTGYGADGRIWGGEALLCNLGAYERFANFAYVPMAGGAAAVKNPLRMAYGVLWAFDLLEHPAAARVIERLGAAAPVCEQMIEGGLNTPLTSSVGRLFDAASALLGICEHPAYEGEGAILLEAAIEHGTNEYDPASERYVIELVKNTATPTSTALDTSVLLLDAAPLFAAMLDDLVQEVPVSVIAHRFHDAFVSAMVQLAELVYGMYGINTVVLAGGVFLNRYLMEHAVPLLASRGFTVAVSRDMPPSDGSLSFGQAVIALRRREQIQ